MLHPVRIHFMTNEIPQALARNNGSVGRLEAVWELVGLGVGRKGEAGGGGLRLASKPCSCPGCHSLS